MLVYFPALCTFLLFFCFFCNSVFVAFRVYLQQAASFDDPWIFRLACVVFIFYPWICFEIKYDDDDVCPDNNF